MKSIPTDIIRKVQSGAVQELNMISKNYQAIADKFEATDALLDEHTAALISIYELQDANFKMLSSLCAKLGVKSEMRPTPRTDMTLEKDEIEVQK